jgi:hypothetical protein
VLGSFVYVSGILAALVFRFGCFSLVFLHRVSLSGAKMKFLFWVTICVTG